MLDRTDPSTLPRAARLPGPDPARRGCTPVPRRIPGGVAATLDALPEAALPRLAYEGAASGLRREMRAAVLRALPRPRWLANWLIDDALGLAALAAELGGAASLRGSLGPEGGPGAGGADLRLVAVYRGAGIAGLARGEVAVLRGGGIGGFRGAGPAGGEAPLLLAVDALAVSPWRQPPNRRASIASQSRST